MIITVCDICGGSHNVQSYMHEIKKNFYEEAIK